MNLTTKTCTGCKETKTLLDFFKDRSRKDGHSDRCKICKTIQNKKSYLSMSEKSHTNRIMYGRKYRAENKEKVKEYHKQKQKEKRAYYTAKQKERETAKRNQMPKWVDKEELFLIREVYDLAKLRKESTGIKWDVDHIIPLQGKNVRGLHTIANLQVIPSKVNQMKSNKVIV
jgi:hypothetical protein